MSISGGARGGQCEGFSFHLYDRGVSMRWRKEGSSDELRSLSIPDYLVSVLDVIDAEYLLLEPGEIVVTKNGVRIWGGKDVPSQLPFHASSLYSRNVVNLLTLLTKPAAEGSALSLNLDFDDEIINGAAVTHAGAKRNGGAK